MVVNGLTSGRSTFFDLVHPTNTQEASAHAHAAINAANNSNGSGSSCSTDTGGALTSVTSLTSGVGGAVQGAVVAGSTAGGPAVAGVMPAKTQPIAISGVSCWLGHLICVGFGCCPGLSSGDALA